MKNKCFALTFGVLVLALASLPTIVYFTFPSRSLRLSQLVSLMLPVVSVLEYSDVFSVSQKDIGLRKNVSFHNSSSCSVTVSVPVDFTDVELRSRVDAFVDPNLYSSLLRPKCNWLTESLLRSDTKTEIIRDLSHFEIRGISKVLNIPFQKLEEGIDLSHLNSSAISLLLYLYCNDLFSNAGLLKKRSC